MLASRGNRKSEIHHIELKESVKACRTISQYKSHYTEFKETLVMFTCRRFIVKVNASKPVEIAFTRLRLQTDGQMDGRMDGQMDKMNPVYLPLRTRFSGCLINE